MHFIKNYPISVLVVLMMYFSGCTDSDPELSPGSCNTSRPVLNKVKNHSGTIWYDETHEIYRIIYGVPGTIDSVVVGIVCNLPETFDSQSINSTRVVFSGNYRELENNDFTGPAGTEFYALQLTQIRKK